MPPMLIEAILSKLVGHSHKSNVEVEEGPLGKKNSFSGRKSRREEWEWGEMTKIHYTHI